MRAPAVFFAGVSAAMFFIAALFFFKFWRASRDRFFLMFSAACILIGLGGAVEFFEAAPLQAVRSAAVDSTSWVYLFRVLAFACILYGVIEKNRSAGKDR